MKQIRLPVWQDGSPPLVHKQPLELLDEEDPPDDELDEDPPDEELDEDPPEEELDEELEEDELPHAPLLYIFTPAALAEQLLTYVIPSQPQTGLWICRQIIVPVTQLVPSNLCPLGHLQPPLLEEDELDDDPPLEEDEEEDDELDEDPLLEEEIQSAGWQPDRLQQVGG